MTEKKTALDFQSGNPYGDESDPPFAPGSPAEWELAPHYEAQWTKAADGFAEHGRRCAKALAMACEGAVHLRQRFFLMPEAGIDEATIALTQTSSRSYSATIHHVILNEQLLAQLVTHPFYPLKVVHELNKLKVISTVFEGDRISNKYVGYLNQAAQVWVPCQANRDMLVRCGVLPEIVRKVPIPYFDDDPLLVRKTRRPGIPRFYHIGKWEPRKAQDRMLLAFLLAFKPGEAGLTIKTSTLRITLEGFPSTPAQALAAAFMDNRVRANGWNMENINAFVEVIEERLPENKIRRLHEYGDCYVSLSLGEGWDLPAFDAKVAGNFLLYTPSGGPQTFASRSDIRVPLDGTSEVHPFYGWPDGTQLGDYNIHDAVSGFRTARDKILSGATPEGISKVFGADLVGRLMRANLEEICENRIVYKKLKDSE